MARKKTSPRPDATPTTCATCAQGGTRLYEDILGAWVCHRCLAPGKTEPVSAYYAPVAAVLDNGQPPLPWLVRRVDLPADLTSRRGWAECVAHPGYYERVAAPSAPDVHPV